LDLLRLFDGSEERANRITNAKDSDRLLEATAVKRSRRSDAEAGVARRGPAAQGATRTALDRLGSGKLGFRVTPLGTMGQGARLKSCLRAKRAKSCHEDFSEGAKARRLAVLVGCILSAVWVVRNYPKECEERAQVRRLDRQHDVQ
jgi:hypothetical protein